MNKKLLIIFLIIIIIVSFSAFTLIFINIFINIHNTRPPDTTPIKSVESTPSFTTNKDDAGIEIIDPPLYRQPLSYALPAKTIKFSIISTVDNDPSTIVDVIMDPATFDYRADTNYENGFYYVHANGSICFGKPEFKNTYCLREKYTPLASIRYLIGDTDLNIRELDVNETNILGLMGELGWIPSNALAGYMVEVESSIKLLQQQKLKDGAVLELTYKNQTEKFGIIKNVQLLDYPIAIKTSGINLAIIMALIYNRQPPLGNTTNSQYSSGFPAINMESADTDKVFEDIREDYGIDIHKYMLIQ